MLMRKIFATLVCCLIATTALAQGTIRGTISSSNPFAPVSAATVLVRGSNPLIHTTMLEDGTFSMEVPTGRQTIEVRSVGFASREYSVVVLPTHETVLDVVLEPLDITLTEVVVSAPYDKSKTLEPLSLAGARSFSTDETYRFASSLGDPARMVRSFAGVLPANDSRNDIIIRGNSPIGLKWVIDGIEVPNLNHFNAGIGLTGGQVSMINTNMLTNSDFHLSAWPAPYGDALSGIFDLSTREGNNRHHEGWGQMGYGGFELGAEGPIPVSKGSNYLISYRYSVPAILSGLKLMKIPTVPYYQDLSAKVDLRLTEQHALSLLGIWGTSKIKIDLNELMDKMKDQTSMEDPTILNDYNQYIDMRSTNFVVGLTHKAEWSKLLQGRTTLSLVRTAVNLDVRDQKFEDGKPVGDIRQLVLDKSTEYKYTLRSDLRWHPSYASMIVAGVVGDLYQVKYSSESDITDDMDRVDTDGRFGVVRAFTQYRYKPSSLWAATVGVHGLGTTLNKSFAVEPRLGVMIQPATAHSIGLAGGLYSQTQPKTFYFARDRQTGEETNRGLGLSRAIHGDLYYDWAFAKDWHVRVEGYYQHLYDIPVTQDPESTWSMLQVGVMSDNSIQPKAGLVNKGTGRNTGVELTLEKFISDHYYLLANATLFESTFTNGFSKKRWHSPTDGGFILNLTGGGEYPINDEWTLTADLKSTYAGGMRYSPMIKKEIYGHTMAVIDPEKAFTLRMRSYFRTDIKLGFRQTKKRFTQELGIDFQNITNRRNVMTMIYDDKHDKYSEVQLQSFGIMATARFTFTYL